MFWICMRGVFGCKFLVPIALTHCVSKTSTSVVFIVRRIVIRLFSFLFYPYSSVYKSGNVNVGIFISMKLAPFEPVQYNDVVPYQYL